MRTWFVLLAGWCWLSTVAAADLSPDEVKGWQRRLIPLPKQMALRQVVTVPAGSLRVRAVGGDDVVAAAAARLTALAGPSTAVPPAFEVLLGRCDARGRFDGAAVPGAERLRSLPHAAQAYAIAPRGPRALVLCGLTSQAVAYAAATLAQWLDTQRPGQALTLPLATVLDWPDLLERGEWGGSASRDIEWSAARKLNLLEAHASLSLTPDGHGRAVMDAATLERGRLHALKVVPIITHLDQLGQTGLFERYPETKGQGEGAHYKDTDVVAPCLSQPKTAEIIADWMTSLAAQPGVDTICIWLSEIGAKCGCAECQKAGQYTLETRACVRAWRLAKERNPKVVLRVLLTQGSYADNDKVLAEIPPGVEVSYYDGGRTYDSSRDPMIYPLLADYAQRGRWLGVYPQLTASWRIVCPWPGPQFIRTRMNEFVDRGLSCLCGYATPDNRLYDFNVTAAAEWSWNAKGRDEREFSRAWATRRGLSDVDRAAEWAVTLGPVGWDVYGSGTPFPQFFGSAGRLLANRQAPVWGKGWLRYFPNAAKFAEDQAACARALTLATQLGDPELVAETRVIQGYLTILEQLQTLAATISRPQPPSDAERQQLNRDLLTLSTAGLAVTDSLKEWERFCRGAGGSRLGDTVQITEQTVADLSKALRPFGVRNPALACFRQKVGGWQDQDFEAKTAIQPTWEVTNQLGGAGTYEVTFVYTKGWHGLGISRVALASAPAGEPAKLTDVVVDQHPGTAAYDNKANVYHLELKSQDPALRYFLVASINGVKSSDKPANRRGCQGDVLLNKARQPGEALALAPLSPPDPAELARYQGPKFTTQNLHLAVYQGGYGSESLLAALSRQAGLETQPLWSLTPTLLRAVQVVILPQPRAKESFRAADAALLTKFVRDGGGVILLHDAVGYRGLPPIAPEVCAGGLDKLKGPQPQIKASHPITAGWDLGRVLATSYYDTIVLQPGPQATVLVTARGGQPVVVAGPAGKGRAVACGLAPGIHEDDDRETPPTADEVALLVNAAKWAGGR